MVSEKEEDEDGSTPPSDNSAFVVFRSALFFLLSFCRNCASNTEVVNVIYRGTMITVKTRCISCVHQLIWRSQPIVNRFPIGNLMIVCGTILSGAAYARVSEIFRFSNLSIFSEKTFTRIQSKFTMQTHASSFSTGLHIPHKHNVLLFALPFLPTSTTTTTYLSGTLLFIT